MSPPVQVDVDEILEALDLSRAEPGSGFLAAVFARFNAKVPFENVTKILRDADVADAADKPRAPGTFWTDHLERGAGGTCFARVAAFDAILSSLGFRTRKALGRVRNPDDHAALLVAGEGGETVADVGFPLPVLLPPGAGRLDTELGSLAVTATEAGIRVEFEEGVPDGPRYLEVWMADVDDEAFGERWRRTFRRGAPFLQEVGLRRDLGNRTLAFARGEMRVDDRHSRLRVPVLGSRAAALSTHFGLDEDLAARALAIAGDPAPPSCDATLTAYLETKEEADGAFRAIASPEAYRSLLEGVAAVEDLRETPLGFRLTLSAGAGPGGESDGSRLDEELSVDPAARTLTVVRRAGDASHRSLYRALARDGRTWLVREATLSGAREDLLRNDSLRGRLAGSLAVDLLAWSRRVSRG